MEFFPISQKRCYPSAIAAWRLLRIRLNPCWRKSHKRTGQAGSAYKCPHCHQWYTTHHFKHERSQRRIQGVLDAMRIST